MVNSTSVRTVAPRQWEGYHQARRRGYNQADSGAIAGISSSAVENFERERRIERRGETSARRSSGWEWVRWRNEVGEKAAEKVGQQVIAFKDRPKAKASA